MEVSAGWGEERSSHQSVPGRGKHLGPSKKQSPFAGWQRTVGLGRHSESVDAIQVLVQRVGDETQVSEVFERANKRRGTFMVLRSRLFGSCNPALLSNSRHRKWRVSLGVARKRGPDWLVASDVVPIGALCSAQRTLSEGLSRLAALEGFFARGSSRLETDGIRRGRVRCSVPYLVGWNAGRMRESGARRCAHASDTKSSCRSRSGGSQVQRRFRRRST